MGLLRKITSVSTLGAVDFKSDKERAAKNTKRTAVQAKLQTAEAVKQTALLAQLAASQAAASTAPPPSASAAGRTRREALPIMKSTSVVDELRGLAELRDNGVLTEAEFEVQKRRLLSEPGQPVKRQSTKTAPTKSNAVRLKNQADAKTYDFRGDNPKDGSALAKDIASAQQAFRNGTISKRKYLERLKALREFHSR